MNKIYHLPIINIDGLLGVLAINCEKEINAKYRHLVELIDGSSLEETRYNIDISKSGESTIAVDINGKRVHLHSTYDPKREAQRWVADTFESMGHSVIVIFGIGLGYHIDELVRQVNSSTIIIVVEPLIQVINAFLKEGMDARTGNWENVYLLFLKDELLQYRLKTIIPELSELDIDLVVFGQYRNICVEEIESLKEILDQTRLERLVQKNTYKNQAHYWSKNGIINLWKSIESVPLSRLKNLYNGKTAIIVSAGPSLTKNVGLLNGYQNKVLILTTATAVPVLEENGITPHYIVTIDANYANASLFRFMKDKNYKIPLVYDLNLEPSILELMKGPKIVGFAENIMSSVLEELVGEEISQIDGGQSVANVALGLARHFGVGRVVFVGQDLVYTDEKTHSDGTLYEGRLVKDDVVEAEDISGQVVKTSLTHLATKSTLELQIKLSSSSIDFVNATESGLLIKGARISSLKDVLNEIVIDELARPLEKLVKLDSKVDSEIIGKTLILYESCQSQLGELKELTEKGLRTIDRILMDVGNDLLIEKINRRLRNLDEIDIAIKSLKIGMKFLHYNIYNEIGELLKPIETNGFIDRLSKTKELYRIINEAIKEVMPVVKGQLEEIIDRYYYRVTTIRFD